MTMYRLLIGLVALVALARVPQLFAQSQASVAAALPAPAAPAQLSIRFEGHNLPDDAAKAIGRLLREGIITSATAPQNPNKPGICGVLIEQTQFPGRCGEELQEVGKGLNPKLNSRTLRSDAQVRYPNVTFRPYNYVRMFNRNSEDDREELAEVRRQYKAFIDKEAVQGDYTVLTMHGSEILVPVDATRQKNLASVMKLRTKDVFVDVEGVAPAVQVKFSQQTTDEALSFEDYCVGPAPGKTYRYIDLIGGFADPIPACRRDDPTCADVVILDTQIFLHPAIASAIVDGARPLLPTPSAAAGQCMGLADYKRELYHGTHMAGIIASSGVPFAGVHSGARLYSRDWDKMGVKETAAEMDRRVSTRGTTMQVYLFASAWSSTDGTDLFLPNINNRYDTRTSGGQLGKRIKDIPVALWVAAAGQKDLAGKPPITTPLDIARNLALSPMNLGDLPNVLIVTACDDCQGTRGIGPSLTQDVNYSTHGLVHVAAPGFKVPSSASQFQYGRAGGTSEAAAFVAGLASAMVAKYPNAYDAAKVKARLQYTATPWVPASDNVVAAGVVDATTALMDPQKDYLNGRSVEIDGWCRPPQGQAGISMVDDGNTLVEPNAYIQTQSVYRIVQQMVSGRRQWFVYASHPRFAANAGEVLRFGPGKPSVQASNADTALEQRPIIKLKNQAMPVRLDGIRDLLVRRGVHNPVVCS